MTDAMRWRQRFYEICEDRETPRHIRSVFGKVRSTRGQNQDYLGMVFDFSTGTTLKISMNMMIEEILNETEIGSITVLTPANDNLYKIDVTSPTLSEEEKAHFYSTVAKLYYVAKRIRPDILLPVSFRATNPAVSNLSKSVRIRRYLNGSRDLVLQLKGDSLQYLCLYLCNFWSSW